MTNKEFSLVVSFQDGIELALKLLSMNHEECTSDNCIHENEMLYHIQKKFNVNEESSSQILNNIVVFIAKLEKHVEEPVYVFLKRILETPFLFEYTIEKELKYENLTMKALLGLHELGGNIEEPITSVLNFLLKGDGTEKKQGEYKQISEIIRKSESDEIAIKQLSKEMEWSENVSALIYIIFCIANSEFSIILVVALIEEFARLESSLN